MQMYMYMYMYVLYICVCVCLCVCVCVCVCACVRVCVTGFTKTDQNVTRTEIQIMSYNINDSLMHCPEASTAWL